MDMLHLVAQIHTHIDSYLVVARAAGVQLFADSTDFFGEEDFDIHMDILCRRIKGHFARLDFVQDFLQAFDDLLCLVNRQNADFTEHPRMCHAPGDIPII